MTLLMRSEAEEESERAEVDFENNLFASNYPMWKELYGKKKEKLEDEVEWVTSSNSDAFEAMVEEMRAMGLKA